MAGDPFHLDQVLEEFIDAESELIREMEVLIHAISVRSYARNVRINAKSVAEAITRL